MDKDEELLISLLQDNKYRDAALIIMQDRKRKRELLDRAKDELIKEMKSKDETKERLLLAKDKLLQAKDALLEAEQGRYTFCKIL